MAVEALRQKDLDGLIEAALAEDGARRDVTTAALAPPGVACEAEVLVKQDGVICGLPLAARVCEVFDVRIAFRALRQDGERVEKGTIVARLTGPAASLLSVERTMLNFLQHLSGVATLTRRFVEAVQGTGAEILDTRKTIPGWRALQKYAVRCGGGRNHRMGLSDQVLIKDNHLRLVQRAGLGTVPGGRSIAGAIEKARQSGRGLVIEVEVENLEQLREALTAGPDIILLDNMTPAQVRKAAQLVKACCAADGSAKRPLIEASGGVTLRNARAYAEAGADRIAIGALTHSAPALDISVAMR